MMFFDSIFFEITLLVAGIAGLWMGADSAIEGSSKISARMGISPLIIGLTVIAVGTSLPELLVCLVAAFKGSADIATGNIIGSNISNIGLIVGISAAVGAIQVRQGIRVEAAAAVVFLCLLLFLCKDGTLSSGEGKVLIALLLPLIVYLYLRQSAKTNRNPEPQPATGGLWGSVLLTATGIATLLLGSDIVVEGAVGIARRAQVPEIIIGVTAVAVGTSLPELVSSLSAVARREDSIAIGNLIGSNLFNILILGLTSSILPLSIDSSIPRFELPFAIAISIIAALFLKKGATIGRGKGILLLLFYAVFLFFVFEKN